MSRTIQIFLSASVIFAAALYQLILKDFIFVSFGAGRVIQPIEDFPYNCRRLTHERLEDCEDIWLDAEKRVLYAACTGTDHRIGWNQAIDRLNASARRPGDGELIALDIDSPGSDGLYNLRVIKPVGYVGATGGSDKSIDFVGFGAQVVDSKTLQFYFVNQRPPVDSTLKILTGLEKTGANSTIDVFELKRGKNEMRHLRTVFSDQVWSPNRVATLGDGAFVATNDHSKKVGFRKRFDPFLGGGNVAYCSSTGKCHAASASLTFPNGLTRGKDGLIYVPSSVDGKVLVFSLNPETKKLDLVDSIELKMPLDNLAVDQNGDIYAAGFPNLLRMLKFFHSPYDNPAPSTILRIRKVGTTYEVSKVLEDKEGKILSGITTVVHDAKTGRLWLGAVLSPYIVTCDPK